MQYPAYFRYYASQAFFHASPEMWNNWNHDNINTLRASQNSDGSWDGMFGQHLQHRRLAALPGLELSLPAHL